jgi:hypothetical protein
MTKHLSLANLVNGCLLAFEGRHGFLELGGASVS